MFINTIIKNLTLVSDVVRGNRKIQSVVQSSESFNQFFACPLDINHVPMPVTTRAAKMKLRTCSQAVNSPEQPVPTPAVARRVARKRSTRRKRKEGEAGPVVAFDHPQISSTSQQQPSDPDEASSPNLLDAGKDDADASAKESQTNFDCLFTRAASASPSEGRIN